jgi:hypothetical protein
MRFDAEVQFRRTHCGHAKNNRRQARLDEFVALQHRNVKRRTQPRSREAPVRAGCSRAAGPKRKMISNARP